MPHATFQRGPCTSTSRAQTRAWNLKACQKNSRDLRACKESRRLSQGKRRQASRNITAAAVSADTTTDLKQLFQDALKTPQKQGGISTPQATTSAPARPQGLDTSKVPAPSNPDQAGFLGQMGPTADGAKSQAQSTAQAVKSQAGPATEAVKSQASPAADAVKSQAQDLAPSKVESVTQGLQPPAPTGTAVNSAKAAGEQLQSQLKSSSDLIPGTGNGPSEVFNSTAQQAKEATSSAVQAVQDAPGSLLDSFNQAVPGLQSSVESAAASVSAQVSDAASSVLDALPAPAAEALRAAASAVQPTADALWTYARSDPKAGAAAAGLVVGLPLLSYWRFRLSGYSGPLPPAKALELLNKTNSLLIDIRREEVRNRDGVPLLRRGSRGKGAAFPIQSVPQAVLRTTKQGQSLRLQIAALQILGLKQVKRGARLVLMDRAGSADAVTLARNIKQLSGRKVYIVAGGFNAWERQGLNTEGTSTNYQTTVLDSITDEAETLVESATTFLRDPVIAVGALGGVALAGVALVDWHYALQYVGVLGAQLTLISWLSSYDTPQDALSDVGSTLQRYSQKASRLIGSKGTSQSTTASGNNQEPPVEIVDDEPESDSSASSKDSKRSQEASVSGSS